MISFELRAKSLLVLLQSPRHLVRIRFTQMFHKLCVLLILLPFILHANALFENFTSTTINGNISHEMHFTVTWNQQYIVTFNANALKLAPNNPYRISVWSHSSHAHTPLMVVVIQEHEVTSWQVPFLVDNSKHDAKMSFSNTSRTLCQNKEPFTRNGTKTVLPMERFGKSFIVTLSSASSKPQTVFMYVEEQKDFVVKQDQRYSISVSPSQTRYVYYAFPDKTDNVALEITSNDDVCLTVSIQDSICPVFDLDRDITYEGKYQTINRKGGMSIRRKDFPNGFFLVFVAKADNYLCSQEHSLLPNSRTSRIIFGNRTSVVDFTIKTGIAGKGYVTASLITLGANFGFCLAAIIIVLILSKWGALSMKKEALDVPDYDEEVANVAILTKQDRLNMVLQRDITLDLLARDSNTNRRRAYNYLWHILSIAIFYSIPVVQLVITYQRIVNSTGDQDMCYYNFLCANPAYGLSDFNHIFSNIGYVLIGILFLICVLYRHFRLPYNDVGVPVQYGVFYAMGVALIIEGILSACYHICPSQSNYQFDTSFMYVMAVLSMIKLYQNRHPDINATAYATFTVLGLTIFLAMIGILNGSLAIWLTFVISYTILCVYISFKIYFVSFVFEGIVEFKNSIQTDGFQVGAFAPMRKPRFFLLLLANLVNYAMLITGLCLYDSAVTDFGTFLLGLLMANAVLYCIFYTSMKLMHHERICAESIIYGVLGSACWGAAAFFFLDAATLWTVTPAESRQYNQQCVWMGFYDRHDVWHLLSAPALYFSFMFLLCLDDDLINTKRTDIHVF